jgi:Domain of unknown function (DUF1864)
MATMTNLDTVASPPADTGRPAAHAAVTPAVDQLDQWIRHEFAELNTRLETAYFAARREILTGDPDLETVKQAIVVDGAKLIGQIAQDGRLPADPQVRYELLGSVGFYLAACRRHEVDRPESPNYRALPVAWSLASRLGRSLGVAPRFVFAHQALHNRAVGGAYRSFTTLEDEHVFITHNGLSALAYQRAANALRRIPALGVSNPMAGYLLEDARAALDEVLRFNRRLGETLDVDRFFLNVRPYFKPYRVGAVEYRGANAGDFAAINEIDLLLGLCSARDPFYRHLLEEKRAYLPPEDQPQLQSAVGQESLLELFLREAAADPVTPQLRLNAERFLAVCRAHGAAYAYHHHQLVRHFLQEPAKQAPPDRLGDLTASGPPLEEVVRMLGRLRDLRAARDRPGLPTARASLDRLRALVNPGP